MTEFRFSNEHTSSDAAQVIDVLRQPRLWIPTETDYPHHDEWLQKTEAKLASGDKRAMAAFMGNDAIGAVIYQQSVDNPKALEIRNISVSTDARGRYVGAFLLRNAEIEAARHDFPEVEEIVVDTKTTNTEMITFLISQGYDIKDVADLYGLGTGMDVILTKSIAA